MAENETSGGRRRGGMQPHRHCTSCHTPISLKNDPPICGEDVCRTSFEQKLRSQKQFRLWGTVIIVLFLVITVGPMIGLV